jgi:uncharacterized protein
MIVRPGIGRALAAVIRLSVRRPRLTVLVSLALAVVGLTYTAHTLTFLTSPYRLLPQQARYVVTLQEYQRDFGEMNDIVVAVQAPTPGEATRFADRLASLLQTDGVDGRVMYRIDPSYFEGRALLYLSPGELSKLRERLYDYEEFLERYAARPTLTRLLDGLNVQMANAMALGFIDLGIDQKDAADLRFLSALLHQMRSHLDGAARYDSPWALAFALGRLDASDGGYFFSSDRRLLFVFVEARRQEGNFRENRERIEGIRAAIARLRTEFPAVQAGVTGGPALSHDEMTAAFDDSKVATVLAFASVLAILLIAFRRFVKPLLMLGTLAVSLAWSMGLITLGVGHLSIFSVMFISIVVGIGIDYGVYLLFRYEEERALGATVPRALERTAERTGPGMLLGALTAAGAFFVLILTDFTGIREFGFVSGTAILMAFLSMITLLPALITMVDGGRAAPADRSADALRETRWLERIVGYRKTILVLAVGFSGLALWAATGVGFSYNLLKLQARGVESVAWEERILAVAGRSGMAALASADNLEELQRKQEAFGRLPSVAKVESVLMLYPDRQVEKAAMIGELAPLLEPVTMAAQPGPVDVKAIRAALETLRRRLNLALEASDRTKGEGQLRAVLGDVDAVLGQLDGMPVSTATVALDRLQSDLARDFVDKLRNFQNNLRPRPVALGEVPPELRQRYVGASGRYLLRIRPAVDIWERAGAERFVTDLRSVDPDVAGPPVTSFEAIGLIRRGYLEGALYALGLVSLVTVAILRTVFGAMLALIPVALGVLWTLGAMDGLGLPFTMANVWAVPLIIGTAAEFGLNVYVRFMEGRETGGPLLARSAVMGVMLNGLTTIAGFGSLMVAKHQGMFGLGLLLALGASASLVASLVVLPVLLQLFLARSYGHSGPPVRPLRESESEP